MNKIFIKSARNLIIVSLLFFSGFHSISTESDIDHNAMQTHIKMQIELTNGLIISAWPMYCHDMHHTGQSPYSTISNTGDLKWKVQVSGGIDSSPVIGTDRTIYVGGTTYYGPLYAINSNGSIKWQYRTGFWITSSPAIADDGTIYVGSWDCYFYAINSNGTLKWRFYTGVIKSSPAIANDGTIYIGSDTANCIFALNLNGTLKWRFNTSGAVECSPAIGDDTTVYITSNGNILYAIFSNNGTQKWSFSKGAFLGSPAIGNDGTIYVASQDGYLYAVYQNGSMKWRSPIGWGSGHVPSIANDETIYIGGDDLYAFYPNGTRKWTFNPGGFYDATSESQAISSDGTIYYGVTNNTGADGYLIAVNPDGTERWREWICNDHVWSSPAIGDDGTVYIGASLFGTGFYGVLYAFGPLDPNAPTAPTVTGQTNGKIRKTYTYIFTSTSPLGHHISYLIDWGDGTTSDWIGPYASGTALTLNHSWQNKGTYLIRARAKDTDNLWGPWGELQITMPFSYEPPQFLFIHWLLERFPHAFPILRYFLNLN